MDSSHALSQAELLARLVSIAAARGATSSTPDDRTVSGTLTAIKSKWFFGGRKVTNSFTCTLDPASHEVHFRESATESSWGLPPPTFSVETTSQYGTRVKETRVEKSTGGGGTLEFGAFRESCERAVQEAGWKFVYGVV